jgi:hypothetical protein
MTDDLTRGRERDEIELLLPWYGTNKLNAIDRGRVETWLARDPALARQLELIEDDRRATVDLNESIRAPRAAIANGAIAGMHLQRLRLFFGAATGLLGDIVRVPATRSIQLAAFAAGIVFMLQGIWIGALLSRNVPAVYQSASGGPAEVGDGSFALVRFNGSAAVKDVADALAGLDMTISSGPTAGGWFRVRIGSKGISATARDERISALRQRGDLVMVATPVP